MKKGILLFLLMALCAFFYGNVVVADSIDDILNQFETEYENLKPEPNSSVNADYKLDRAALGAFYTTKSLSEIYKQNQVIIEKYDQMLEKYDTMIEQNKKIIQLLSKNIEPPQKNNRQ